MPNNFGFESSGKIIRFGNFILDLDAQSLSTGDSSIRLRSKLCLVLEYLVTHKNRLISRDELITQIWQGNSYTGEQAVTHSICHLRKLLSSLGNESTRIDTIPKRGYRLLVQTEDNDNNDEPRINIQSSSVQFSYSSTSNEFNSIDSPSQVFTVNFG